MQKFFVKSSQIEDDEIRIIGTDVNHIINVLRLKVDDEIQVCNEETRQNYICKINNYNKEEILCGIVEKIESKAETKVVIDVYQGVPKADKMELIIQKTTELGAKSITPVAMERCVSKITGKDENKKIERWQKIAEVAAKQSKRDVIPTINNVNTIKELCLKIKDYDIFLVAYEEERQQKLKTILQQAKIEKIGVLIGPEGGIDKKEIDMLVENGAKIVTLGNRILRTETAPIAIVSNIVYELES